MEGDPVWFGPGQDANGAKRTAFMGHDDIIGHPDHFVQRTLVPRTDIVLDFHSGGKTFDFLPFAAIHALADKAQEAACAAAMQAFNAPYSMRMREIDNVGMFDTAVEDGARSSVRPSLAVAAAQSITIPKNDARNLLIQAGILTGDPEMSPTVYLDCPMAICSISPRPPGRSSLWRIWSKWARLLPASSHRTAPAHIAARPVWPADGAALPRG